jgi:hypothetical protein
LDLVVRDNSAHYRSLPIIIGGNQSSRAVMQHLSACLLLLRTILIVRGLSCIPLSVVESFIAENFSTAPPVSLYGVTKFAWEILALEYGEAFGLRVGINRCGMLAGAGQFA